MRIGGQCILPAYPSATTDRERNLGATLESQFLLWTVYDQYSKPMWLLHPGAEYDESSGASSDGESEKSMRKGRGFQCRGYKKSFSPTPILGGMSSILECSTFGTVDDEGGEVWSYFEHSPPYSRVPLCIRLQICREILILSTTLCAYFGVETCCSPAGCPWLGVYPIYRIPTGPTLRDLAACFLTFRSLSTPLWGGRRVTSALHLSPLSTIAAMSDFSASSLSFKGGKLVPDSWKRASYKTVPLAIEARSRGYTRQRSGIPVE